MKDRDAAHLSPSEIASNSTPPGWLSFRRSKIWRIFSPLLAVAAVALSGYYIVAKLSTSFQQVASLQLELASWPVVLSLLITLLCLFCGGLIWYWVLRSAGEGLGWKDCMRMHLLANLGGYIPGYGWKHVGKAYLAQRCGVALKKASWAVLVEFISLALTRAVVAILTAPVALYPVALGRSPATLWLLRLGALGVLLAFPWALEKAVGWGQRSSRSFWTGLEVHKGALGLALLAMSLTWLLYGLGFAVLLQALRHLSLGQFLAATSSTSISFLASLIMFFVPAGLGIRESVLIYTLSPVLPEGIVTVGALVSRVILILSELIGSLIGSGMGIRRRLCK